MALRAWSTVWGSVNGKARYSGGMEWEVANSDEDRIANNRSLVRLRMFGATSQPQYGAWNLDDNTSWFEHDWGNRQDVTTRYDWRNAAANTRYYVGDGTSVFPKGAYREFWVYHNADGTRQLPIKTYLYGGVDSFQNITTEATITLPTIPRQADITGCWDFNDEQNPVMYFNNPAGVDVMPYLEFGGTAIYRPSTNHSSPYTFVLTENERNLIRSKSPNSNSIPIRFGLRTDMYGTYYLSTADRTVSIVNAEPSITGSYKDVNATIVNITGNNQLLIRGLSNAEITANPTTRKYATVSSVQIAGTTVGSPYKRTLNAVDANSVEVKVTDSRGYTATAQVNFNYTAYEAITFLASFFRTAAMNNEVALEFSGTFFNQNIGTTANTLSARYRYQPELGEWSEWFALDVVVDGNNFSNTGDLVSLGSNFMHNMQHRFEIEFSDAIDVKTNTIIVRAGRNVLKVTESVQVLQGKLHVQKLFTKDDKDFVFDFVYDIITRTWLVHVYGLTQMFEPQHVFQSDVNARSIITVLNQDDYPLLKYTIDDTANNFKDYINVDEEARYNNYTMVDTGICPLPEVLEKRARELQFTIYNANAQTLNFYVSAYIDSYNVVNPEHTTIDWIDDPEDPNYGKLYVVEEEVANIYGETYLDQWLVDMSKFPKTVLAKSHLRIHGKGLFFRATIVNRDMIEHELSGITWVYRIMNAR